MPEWRRARRSERRILSKQEWNYRRAKQKTSDAESQAISQFLPAQLQIADAAATQRYGRCFKACASMVFVSPFSLLRKCVLLIICVGFTATSSFAQRPALFMVGSTPYDSQMAPVRPILTSAGSYAPGRISLMIVTQWMSELRGMPYQYSPHWQTPAEVNFTQAADCKGKAVALYAEMRSNGARNVRVVIGKHHIYDSNTHAWLEWETAEGSYMLDPTFNEMPIKTAELYPMTYIPSFAYDEVHKYRAGNAGFGAPSKRVATGYRNRVYVPSPTGATFAHPGFTGMASRSFFPVTTESASLNTRQQLGTQRSWSDEQGFSSPNVGGFRQFGAPVTNPNPALMISTRHSTSNGVRRSHVRSSAHHRRHVIRTQPRRLASSS